MGLQVLVCHTFNNASFGNGNTVDKILFSLPNEFWSMPSKCSPPCNSCSGTTSPGNIQCLSNRTCPLNIPCAKSCDNDFTITLFI